MDAKDIADWLRCDNNEPGIEILSSEEDVNRINNPEDLQSVVNDDSKDETPTLKISFSTALARMETVLEFYQGQNNFSFTDFMFLI